MDWREAERQYTDEVIGETTIPRAFFDAVERHGSGTCQRYKGVGGRSLVAAGVVPEPPAGEYGSLTYAEVGDIVRRLAAGFRELGVEPDDRVGIYADTRMEWIHADMALMSAGGVTTTVYTESSAPQVEYLLNDPGATGVVVGTRDLLETLAEVEGEVDLDFAVVMDDVDDSPLETGTYTLGEVHEMGSKAYDEAAFESWLDGRDWSELASLVYTSGTTGDPKGVMLTHRNWRTALNQVRKRIGPRPDKPDDIPTFEAGKTSLSFLPMAHAFERFNHFSSLAVGMTIAYAESTDTIQEDIASVRPEAAASVPRVYERIFDGMRSQAAESDLKKRIFDWAVDTAQAYDDADDPGFVLETKLRIADRLVYSQVREALGGNIEMFISGGGSLSEGLARLYRAMGLTILEGYGMTETAPVCTLNPPEDIRVGTMGPALCDIDYRLDSSVVGSEQADEYEGEVGELLVAGPNVTQGYWNKPDRTEDSFTEDVPASRASGESSDVPSDGRYFRTGDVVAVDDDGYFTFVDRVKQLIVLDTGKNIAPEPIEDEFSTSERVDQIMVVGQDQKFVGAVIVPNFESLRAWAAEEGIDLPESRAEVVRMREVRDWVEEEVERVNEVLGHHETIKEFRLVPTEWTAENDLLTPSMKKKRRNIKVECDEEIADIYGKEPGEVRG